MEYKQKLELTWIGKDKEIKIEPRILLHDKEKSYGDASTENMLIHGDNLIALKALEQDYSGKIKCIYIDPPYNTGSAFEHYDDGLEHSIWLNMIRSRLIILHNLLADDGHIFVQIDNNEMAYLKILMDEIFGRKNYVNDIVWKRRGGSANPNNRLNNVTDYILWYTKSSNYELFPIYTLEDENTKEYIKERFKNEINGKKYMLAPIERNRALGLRETLRYEYNGYIPAYGWMVSEENLKKLDNENRLHWNSKGRPNRRVFLEDYKGQPISNLWTDIKVVNPMSKERLDFNGQKPEMLISRILELCTKEGDLVLDSFGGTGTTAATAHKMGRKWIMIELGEQYSTYIIPRLKKIIDGTDDGGITGIYNWQGGGGFKFYKLAPSLLKKDKYGNWVINKEQYNADMLAAAMAKLNGFKYNPDENTFWKQGQSYKGSYIFTTTQYITAEYLDMLSQELQLDESLLVCCSAYDIGLDKRYDNIVIKKIPQAVLDKCDFGVVDYNMNIVEIPEVECGVEEDE